MTCRTIVSAVLALGLSGWPAAEAAGIDALKTFSGSWRGKGKVVVRDGRPAERIVCRTSGRLAGATFTISGRCGGGSQSGTFSITIRSAGGNRYTGSWRSPQARRTVPFSGSGTGKTFRFRTQGTTGRVRVSSITLRSLSAGRFRISASGRDIKENVAGTMTVDFRKK